MALYNGFSNQLVNLIASNSITQQYIRQIYDEYTEPYIGELRFDIKFIDISQNLSLIDGIYIPTKNFNGWTIPNGGRYKKSNFPQAWEVYHQSEDNYFNVPNLTTFLKVINSNIINEKEKRSGQNQLVKHQHKISETGHLGSDITIPNGFAVCITSSYQKQVWYDYTYDIGNGKTNTISVPGIHNIKPSSLRCPVPMNIDVKFKDFKLLFSDGESNEVGIDNAKFEPTSNYIPAMIYIGKPNI